MTYRPTPASAANCPDLIHTSTRTLLSTNADPAGTARTRVVMRVTKLEIRWVEGDVAVRFQGNTIDITPSMRHRPGRLAG